MWPETGNLQLVQGRRESAASMSQTDLPLTTHAQVFMYVIVLSRAGTPEITLFLWSMTGWMGYWEGLETTCRVQITVTPVGNCLRV